MNLCVSFSVFFATTYHFCVLYIVAILSLVLVRKTSRWFTSRVRTTRPRTKARFAIGL